MFKIQVASCSETGARSRNEDRLRFGASRIGTFAVLADGAGGHSRGEEAAELAVNSLERNLRDDSQSFSPENLTEMVCQAHAELQRHQDSDSTQSRMHCTLVVLWVDSAAERALWTHVGDSRLYRIRHGRVDVVTADDSVVQRLLQAGVIRGDQVRGHPQKNQLMAALGITGEVEPHTVVRAVEVMEGDAFLLCSDGWWEHFEHRALQDGMGRALTPQAWLDQMREQVLAQNKPRQDNFSAVALWVGDPGEVTYAGLDDTQPRAGLGR